ncbi:putative alpha-ketoglutarate-dependent hypophosphite dioxygenase isoform X2 [Oculina patagonica]
MTKCDGNFDLEWEDNSSKPRLKRVHLPSTIHPLFEEIHHDKKLLDIICDLIGPSIRYIQHDCLFLYKPEGGGSPIKWHQDWAFWPHTNQSLVTGFLSIDDSTRENGCLQVIPGSHKGPLYNHHIGEKFASEINDASFDPSRAVHLEVPAGGISFHHPFTVHGAAPNQSNAPKRFIGFSFGATDAWPLIGVVGKENEVWGPVDWDRYCSTVVRGKASKFPRMESIPVLLPVPFTSESRDLFFSDQSKSIHGLPT